MRGEEVLCVLCAVKRAQVGDETRGVVTSAAPLPHRPRLSSRAPSGEARRNEWAPLSQPCSQLDSGNTDTSPGPQGWRLDQEA